MQDLTEAQLSAIKQILLDCGKEARQLAAQPFQVFEKGLNDYVTTVDQALDKRLLAVFQALFPQDGIITEENFRSQQTYQHDYARYWLIDPIDGTEEFMQQGQSYAIMVGLVTQHQPRAGWVYAPAYDHLYWGGLNWGLFEQRSGAAPAPLVPQIPVPVGGPVCPIMIGDKDQRRFGDAIAQAIPTTQFATSGSFGLKVLEVIKGQVGLYLYLNGRVKLWDTTGPIALAQAAGLICCDLEGNPLRFDPEVIDPATLAHQQSILVGWPQYIEALRPTIKQAVAQVLAQEVEAKIRPQ
ncbi:inositol monophosphatase family protein [Pseudanabaena sp. FACHB-2040]|uniref:3'(2'),5'-bisphosphate nucleotidase CysQ family protein n=1 Tax=Pseudanabaena sp. FACHB-2040 TaxID=2692859 RepID=UPI0016886FDC|nr:inositol monophosphatase family protein [Pseudanabaena sp. FACHB-2040]MBD2257133.1 inositol monophosphatase family protein [Pseudanabaena sp. FACHB-2040]